MAFVKPSNSYFIEKVFPNMRVYGTERIIQKVVVGVKVDSTRY